MLLSAQAGATRVGGVLMFFFDYADPPLLIAKAMVYLSRKRMDMYQFMADRLFELFAVAFFVTRNIMFNYVAYVILAYDHQLTSSMPFRQVVFLKSMIVVLVILMTFWLGLIIKAAIYQKSNRGNADDIREFSSDSEAKKKF